MKLSRTPIATAVALVIMSAVAPVHAQDATATADLSAVTVTGIRASVEQSMNQKRNADTHVEVITAEDIGKMPDKNVADSLQRVTGVSISSASASEGGFDENDRVSMRGTNPSLTQTLINGHPVASGDWFVLSQTGQVGRSVSYSLLPSEVVGSVVVHKGAQASDTEGGVVGSVDIITRKPLDFKKALTAEVSVGAVYADLPNKTDPQFNALFNWKNPQNTVGVLFQLFSETRNLRRDGQELLGYEQIKAGSAVATAHPDLANVWYPTLIGAALFEQKRERNGGLLDVQLKPTNDLTLDFSGFTSQMKASNYNRNYMLWGAKILGQGAGQSPDAGYVVRNNTLVSATFAAVPGTQYGVYDQISRPDSSSGSNFFNFDAKLRVNDALTLTGQIGTSSADGKTPTQNVAEWNTGVGTGASWALNGINSAASWGLGTANNASPAGVGLGWIFGDQNIDVKDKDNWLKLDGDYALEQGALTKVKFGLRVADHSRSSAGVIGQGPGCKTTAGANLGFDWSQQYWCPVGTKSPADPANFPSGYSSYPANFGSGLGGSVPSNIWYYSPGQLATYNVLSNRSADGSRLDWNSTYSLKENTNSAYVQGNLDGKGWSGDVGLRMVQTKEHVVNNAAVDATTPGAVTTSAFGPYLPVSTDHDYIDALPSANLRLDLRKDLVARFGLSKSMTRPDYSALAGFISLSPGTGSGSGGNPDLKPVRSTNLDATLEWYFAPRSLASVSTFYMDLTSYIGYGHVDKYFMTYSADNAITRNGQLDKYTLTVPVNSSATVKGLELGYEQPLFTHFGVAANYTYTEAREQGGGPVVGASRDIYNLSAYYEDERLNARVSYNHRSSFFSGLDRSTAFYQADTDTVSASLGYKVSDNISLSLDARNLNNPKLRYYALNQDQPRSVYQNGRQYYLTARMTF